jgi:uncharacterized protein
VAKRRSKKGRGGGWLPLFLLILIACAGGWYLLRPIAHHHRASSVAVDETAFPVQTPPQTEPPVQTESESPTTSPSATPVATSAPTAAASIAPNGPKLALIVDDCGQWVSIEQGFIALPVPLTLSVLPHVHAATQIAQEANDAGKGVMLHLPMETLSGMYPGPGEVKTTMTDAQITAQVEDDLAQVPLAQGVNNHEGSKASADPRVMRDVMTVLSKHGGLFFIDSRTNAASVGEQVARAAGIPTASRDVFLDNREDVAYSEGQLREAAAIAKRTGSAIAIGHPRATTLTAVREMIPQLQAEGIQFVLVSGLTH